MEINILHVPGQQASRIKRVGDREHLVISARYSCSTLGRKLEADTWGSMPEELLELCLPYLNVRDRASHRAVCRAWKRIIDGFPKENFPGKYWLYATPASTTRKRSWEEMAKKSWRPDARKVHEQDNTLLIDVINLGRLDHSQLKDMNNMIVVVVQHLLGFISKHGVLVFNPLATGADLASSRFRKGFKAHPTFAGLYPKPGPGFVGVVGRLTSEDNFYYTFDSEVDMVDKRSLTEEFKPIGSATYFAGKLYWPTRFGEVVSFADALWEHLGKPTREDETLLWHQGLFVWNDNLYCLGYVKVGCKEVNKIWKLSAPFWEEQEMLPSHPCDSGLPVESEGQALEIVLVIPLLRGRQAEADHSDVRSLHAGILAFNRSCSKWWWVSHCLHLWQAGGVVSRNTPSVLNEFKPNQLLRLHRPSFAHKERSILKHNVQLVKSGTCSTLPGVSAPGSSRVT